MMFSRHLDEREKRALLSLATLSSSLMTTAVSEDCGQEVQAYSTTPIAPSRMFIFSSGSWTVTEHGWPNHGALRPSSDMWTQAYVTKALEAAYEMTVGRAATVALFPTDVLGLGGVGPTFIGDLNRWDVGFFGATKNERPSEVGPPSALAPRVRAQSPRTSPTARRGSSGHGSISPMARWFKSNKQAFAGQWVALDPNGDLVDSDASRAALRRRLIAAGKLEGIVFTKVPDIST